VKSDFCKWNGCGDESRGICDLGEGMGRIFQSGQGLSIGCIITYCTKRLVVDMDSKDDLMNLFIGEETRVKA